MDPVRAARLRILGAAALFSSGGALIKGCALLPWQVASFRAGVGALALLVLVPQARRPAAWSWRTPVAGLAYAGTVLLFALATRLTTAANAIFLQSTAPLYLLLLGPLLLREPMRARDLPFLLTLAAGMSLFFLGAEAPRETAPDPVTGNILAAASGLTWALTLAGLRWLSRDPGADHGAPAAATVAGNAIAFFVALPFALPVAGGTPGDWAIVAVLGVLQIGAAYALLTRSTGRVTALEATLLLLLEPVLNPVWAWAVHGETPGLASLAGGAVILGALVVRARGGGGAAREGGLPRSGA